MSTIIIRLQNLPLSAKAADIREFFGDLKIPKGSVNIVGGQLGDAFIGFASDEDARLAMLLEGRLLHNSKIRLMLSSKREMEQVISSAQAYATKGPIQMNQNENQNSQNTFSPPDPSQKESVKLEVNPPGFPFTQQPPVSIPFQQPTQQNLLEQPVVTQIQQTFSSDSWKTPTFPPQQATLGGQQQQQILQQQTTRQVPTVFEGNVQNNIIPSLQHQYQQLIQNFPPQVGQPPPSQQFRIQTSTQQQQQQFRPTQPTASQNLYNTQQQNTRFSGLTQTGQQQTFYSNPPPQFGQQSRTQFNQRGSTQSFGQQQQFGGNYRGGHKSFGGPRFQGQQRSFDSDRDKRRRSRSPPNEQRKRLNIVSDTENDKTTTTTSTEQQNKEYGKGRFCVQLSNVPYKAAFNDINEYLSLARAVCIKVTRVYIPDKNYTDRWIVEFDNEENSRALIKFRGEIFSRTIRAELIPNRRADEQYAVAEPDERDSGRGRFRRDVRRDRSRSRNRERSRDRQRDSKDRPSSREDSGPRSRRRSVSPSRKRSVSRDRFPRERNRDFNRDEQRNRDENFGNNQQYQQRRNSTFGRRGGRVYDNNNGGSNNNNSHQPVPLFGAFAFPSTQANQAVYNAKSGSTVQLGSKDLKPLPLRSFGGSSSQFFPTPTSNPNFRFPSILYQNGPPPQINRNGTIQTTPTSPTQNIQLSQYRQQFGQQQNIFTGGLPNFSINTRMTGQNLNFGGINLRQNTTQQQSPPKSSSPIQQTFPMDSTNALIIQEDNCSVDGKGNESSGELENK
uniref:RRM domain-containing protein n=1 Tax=Meloidogyne hapla TaxID=6305 RepID=A0A1I8BFB3_MELHA